nr:MAG TPA: hypothetical protein [Caudoviricetes sp.]
MWREIAFAISRGVLIYCASAYVMEKAYAKYTEYQEKKELKQTPTQSQSDTHR